MIPFLRLPAALTALAAAAALSSSRATAAEPDATPASTASPAAAAATPASTASPAATVPAPTPVPTPAITAAQHAAAEELVAAMHSQSVVENANKQMQQSIEQVADGMSKTPNISPELTADVQKMREDATTLIAQKLGWETMKEDVVRSYAEDFTEGEMKEITAFYRTPTGEKLIEKQPKLAEKLTRTMRQRSMMVVPILRQRLQTLNIKLRPPAPVRPLGSPSASPGAAAVPPAVPMVPAAPTATPPTAVTPPVTSAPVPAPTAASSPAS